MIISEGDRVVVVAGMAEGHFGTVDHYDETWGRYVVVPDGMDGVMFGCEEHELALLEEELEAPPFGMSSQQLADYVSEFIGRATSRVIGVGNEQYSEGDYQKFEAMPLDSLMDMLQEELQDAAVYAAMLDIRIQRYRNSMKGL